tara:strand:- start:140 stop:556 length:417 start_codon:yes stop_codon:yes gene_type:complete
MKNIDDIDILMMDKYIEDENKTAYNKIKRMILTRAKSLTENNSTLPPKQESRSVIYKPLFDGALTFDTDEDALSMDYAPISDYSEYPWARSFGDLLKRKNCDKLPKDVGQLFAQVGTNKSYTQCYIRVSSFENAGLIN